MIDQNQILCKDVQHVDNSFPGVNMLSTTFSKLLFLLMHFTPQKKINMDNIIVVSSLSCVQLFCHASTVAHQAPLSMGFPRQEYYSGLPLPSPGDLSDPGIEPMFPALAGELFTTLPPGKPIMWITDFNKPKT